MAKGGGTYFSRYHDWFADQPHRRLSAAADRDGDHFTGEVSSRAKAWFAVVSIVFASVAGQWLVSSPLVSRLSRLQKCVVLSKSRAATRQAKQLPFRWENTSQI
jgi:hypothetical protein